jgi:hypothetical protein
VLRKSRNGGLWGDGGLSCGVWTSSSLVGFGKLEETIATRVVCRYRCRGELRAPWPSLPKVFQLLCFNFLLLCSTGKGLSVFGGYDWNYSWLLNYFIGFAMDLLTMTMSGIQAPVLGSDWSHEKHFYKSGSKYYHC